MTRLLYGLVLALLLCALCGSLVEAGGTSDPASAEQQQQHSTAAVVVDRACY